MPTTMKEFRLTERRNPASRNFDRMNSLQMIRLMNREDRKVADAVAREIPAIARAVDEIVKRLRGGGRMIYVGAGSSGRLAMLDAAECPPTFGVSRAKVQALIAGGRRAITDAVEGAEDSVKNAVRDLRRAKLSRKDVVVGVAASATTPYVLGAIRFAKTTGAMTIGVAANRAGDLRKLAEIFIAPEAGPEVLTGSTRLKAGTAQKMVLNMLSTAAMVQLGHAYENLMIDAVLTNKKLEGRAVRILQDASGASVSSAEHALRASGHSMRLGLVMLKRGVNAKDAKKLLRKADGNLRLALGETNGYRGKG
ncbi:MAG: N-acetylmuramic acid 6-phosphate etherase [Acidobacteria bacterium]|nr:N-acetylmuramic acid 6-phosphate etherase [Acidobacteriota bacterium]MBS1865989.1 N-acetylmuramic acid 6-phosphate etherase [Acidobacteriota bacterium]